MTRECQPGRPTRLRILKTGEEATVPDAKAQEVEGGLKAGELDTGSRGKEEAGEGEECKPVPV